MNNIKRTSISLGTLGDSHVGKSVLTEIYLGHEFIEEYISTIGINANIKEEKLIINDEEQKIKIKIWDTAGQEKYKSIATSYIKTCNGIFLIYAINDRKSFENIEIWLNEVEEKKRYNSNVPLVLIGNKIDLENERVVSKEEGEKLAEKYNIEFFECSAKKGINVNEAFQYLIDSCVEIHHDDIFNAIKKININNEKVDNNCCKGNKKKK